MDMTKKDAEAELKETKRNFTRLMEKYDRDPQRAHPELTECERASIQMSTSRKKNSISTTEENGHPWKSSGRRIRISDQASIWIEEGLRAF